MDSAWEQEKPEATLREMLENAAESPASVHALLGAFMRYRILNLINGIDVELFARVIMGLDTTWMMSRSYRDVPSLVGSNSKWIHP